MEILVCSFCGAKMQILQASLEYNFPCPQCHRMIVVLNQEIIEVSEQTQTLIVQDKFHVGINIIES